MHNISHRKEFPVKIKYRDKLIDDLKVKTRRLIRSSLLDKKKKMDKLRIKFFFFHYRNDQLSRTEKLHNCRIIFINFTRVVYQIISNDTTRYTTVISERVYVFYRQRCCFLKYFVYNAYSRRYIYIRLLTNERTK